MKIGIDICKNDRFDGKEKLASKFLHSNELIQLSSLSAEQARQFLVSRWALKEAIYKVNNNIRMCEVEIYRDDTGVSCNLENIIISLSHEKEFTVAVALDVSIVKKM